MWHEARLWIARWLDAERSYAFATRVGALLVLVLWAIQGYRLGWTSDLIGSVGGGSAWGERDRYSGLGLASLEHLSATNIARSVMVVPLLAVFAYALIWPARVHRHGVSARLLLLAALGALAIYSVVVKDVPFNFYGSRYFLPLVVPLVLFAFGGALAGWNQRFAAVLLAGMLLANGYYATGLVISPAYQGGSTLQATLAGYAKRTDVTFVIGGPATRKLLLGGLMGQADAPVVFVDSSELQGEDLRAVLDSYLGALHAEQATLVSERMLPFGTERERIEIPTSAIPFAIRYDTYQRQSLVFHYYVATYRDQASVLTNPHPQWIEGGTITLPVSPPPSKDMELVVRTAGGWLWAMRKGGTTPRIAVRIAGREAVMVGQQGGEFRFAVPGPLDGPQVLEISTSTFVPAELGINTDRRSLGADLVSIRFEAAAPLDDTKQ